MIRKFNKSIWLSYSEQKKFNFLIIIWKSTERASRWYYTQIYRKITEVKWT